MHSEAGAGVGTGVERYLDATISGFWMSTVAITVGCETGPFVGGVCGGARFSSDGASCFVSWRLNL